MEGRLKVGDKVYRKQYQRFGDRVVSYNMTEVERLTKTQAILRDGTKLINEPTTDYNKNVCFSEYGERSNRYKRLTDEIIKEQAEWKNAVKAVNWFDAQKWTEEQKIQVFNSLTATGE